MIPDINLLPKYERENVVLYRLFIVGLIVVLLMFMGLMYTFFHTKTNISKLDDQHDQLLEQQMLLETKLATAETGKSESLVSIVQFAEEYVIPTSMLIEEFVNLLPEHASIRTYDYVFGFVGLELDFMTKSDISTYVVNLLDSDYMNDVKIDRMETIEQEGQVFELPYEKVHYSLDISLAKLKEAKLDE